MLQLPWQMPLEDWPEEILAALPRGISRHTVRFVRVGGSVMAIKEINHELASREYSLLRQLKRLDVPCVTPVAVVSGRVGTDGKELDACLVTKHLKFSLPYRVLFSQDMQPDTLTRSTDALAALLVRVHLTGFFWGDVSLSNALFRRDAGAFAAYLVDAETGELREKLSDGQRGHDLEIARVNIAGEFMDLQAGEFLPDSIDPVDAAQLIVDRYHALWDELTGIEAFEAGELWRVNARIERLNELGFDVDELDISTDYDGTQVHIQPKVVDPGHHRRRLLRLTGIDAQENQARRLLNDLDQYRAATHQQGESEEIVAHQWVQQVYEPVIRSLPKELRGKIEAAEMFHEVLEHRWYMSEQQGYDVPMSAAVLSYVNTVLPAKPEEESIMGVDTMSLPVVGRFRE